jgi:hypothetical protein
VDGIIDPTGLGEKRRKVRAGEGDKKSQAIHENRLGLAAGIEPLTAAKVG